jgi:hypothetical protein
VNLWIVQESSRFKRIVFRACGDRADHLPQDGIWGG